MDRTRAGPPAFRQQCREKRTAHAVLTLETAILNHVLFHLKNVQQKITVTAHLHRGN